MLACLHAECCKINKVEEQDLLLFTYCPSARGFSVAVLSGVSGHILIKHFCTILYIDFR